MNSIQIIVQKRRSTCDGNARQRKEEDEKIMARINALKCFFFSQKKGVNSSLTSKDFQFLVVYQSTDCDLTF